MFLKVVRPYQKSVFLNFATEEYLNLIFFCNCHAVLDQNHIHSCLFSIIFKNIRKNLIESMIFIDFLKTLKFFGNNLKTFKGFEQNLCNKGFPKVFKTEPLIQRFFKDATFGDEGFQ